VVLVLRARPYSVPAAVIAAGVAAYSCSAYRESAGVALYGYPYEISNVAVLVQVSQKPAIQYVNSLKVLQLLRYHWPAQRTSHAVVQRHKLRMQSLDG